MFKVVFSALLVVVSLTAVVTGQPPPAKYEPVGHDLLKWLWPELVPMPAGMALYKKTQFTQRLAITNGAYTNLLYRLDQDDYWQNDFAANPNNLFPWKVSGGLHNATRWESHVALALPVGERVTVWDGHTPNGQRLPKKRWSFPTGTMFADLLTMDNHLFELRTLTLTEKGWAGRTAWESARKPSGYVAPKHVATGHPKSKSGTCFHCHDSAGSSLQYGISVRGDSKIFSWSPFVEGTLTIDPDKLTAVKRSP